MRYSSMDLGAIARLVSTRRAPIKVRDCTVSDESWRVGRAKSVRMRMQVCVYFSIARAGAFYMHLIQRDYLSRDRCHGQNAYDCMRKGYFTALRGRVRVAFGRDDANRCLVNIPRQRGMYISSPGDGRLR